MAGRPRHHRSNSPHDRTEATLDSTARRGKLVLTRRVGEVLHIGDGITITVENATPGVVKLSIQAPADVSIMRAELLAGAEERPGSTGQGGC
jgi:carbon storage regulator